MAEKIRLDVYLTENGMVQSRERAKSLIMAGQVYVDNQKCDKAGTMIDKDKKNVEIRGNTLKYVSRGGLKLEKAMAAFPISLEGKTAMDIGASTGGFTDCMLQNGAVKVYAVDVGCDQLAEKLRNDDRVINLENVNARYISEELIPEKLDFASVDVSFISLKLILPAVTPLIKPNGAMVCLIKPQFEAGRENLNKHGVVKDKKVHENVITSVCEFVREMGWDLLGLDHSPIKGPEGNIEYLIYISPQSAGKTAGFETSQEKIVELAHAVLG